MLVTVLVSNRPPDPRRRWTIAISGNELVILMKTQGRNNQRVLLASRNKKIQSSGIGRSVNTQIVLGGIAQSENGGQNKGLALANKE